MQRDELRPLLRKEFPRERTYLLPALHFLQHELGHLPEWALQVLSWHLRVPASEVYGAVTSYSELRLNPAGTHLIRVCTGLSCWSNGGRQLLEHLCTRFNLEPGQTTPDGRITLEETPCGFLCPMAPAVQVDQHWQGRVTLDLADQIDGLA